MKASQLMPTASIYQPSDFPNQLGLLRVTADDIIGQIRGYTLRFIQVRDYSVERMIQFPPFIKGFYNCVYRLGRRPTQDEYYQFYLWVNKDYFSTNQFSQETYLGLQARVFRTYPSLVRDLYFNKLLEANNRGF